MLLIYPPVAKPSEPPAGLAKLAGALRSAGFPCTLFDANLAGLEHLLAKPLLDADDTWSRRACRNLKANQAALRSPALYGNLDRYKRAVSDVSRVLALHGKNQGIGLSLANYQDPTLSPIRSADLLQAAETPENNLYYAWFSQRLAKLVEDTAPSHAGLSVNYLSQALPAFAMAGFLKRHYPHLPIIMGGGLVTSWLRHPGWSNPFSGLVDHLIAGPGEGPLLKILGAENLLPQATPDYSDLAKNAYLAPGFILPYAAASGCWWNRCSFCPEKAEGNPYAPLATDRVLGDLDSLAGQTRPSLLHLLDNAVHPALLQALTEQPIGIPWYGFIRISEMLCDRDFCRALRRSGCVMLKLGIESGDQKVLERMEKGIDLDVSSRALEALREAGIATYVYLLFGTPGESRQEARHTLEFVRRHHEAITFLNLAIFNLPMASKEASELKTRDFYEGNLSFYQDFEHPRGWDRQKVRRFLEQEFKRDPLVAPILHRDPPVFTSNHAALLQQGCRFV
ncbi:MAG: radical SAM protein [Deltaproteobacteria bacterium]|nr:radical SAM protein [Deltaproteobacteria bacterium]